MSEENPVLRQVAEAVPVKDMQSERIQKVIAIMKKALAEQDDGIGLAAPQIGIPLRIFIVSKKVLTPKDAADDSKAGGKTGEKAAERTGIRPVKIVDIKKITAKVEDQIFINPVLIKESREKKWMEGEGCLSVRWVYGKVKRSTKVTLRAHDEKGKLIERGASGILAHIFQHEVDHLNGILFIDKAKDLEHVNPNEKSE